MNVVQIWALEESFGLLFMLRNGCELRADESIGITLYFVTPCSPKSWAWLQTVYWRLVKISWNCFFFSY